MTITAKFQSVCPACQQTIRRGVKVTWTKGAKAQHVTCPAKATAPPRLQQAHSPVRTADGEWQGRFWGDFYEVIGSARYQGYFALRATITGTVYDYGFLGWTDAVRQAQIWVQRGGVDMCLPGAWDRVMSS